MSMQTGKATSAEERVCAAQVSRYAGVIRVSLERKRTDFARPIDEQGNVTSRVKVQNRSDLLEAFKGLERMVARLTMLKSICEYGQVVSEFANVVRNCWNRSEQDLGQAVDLLDGPFTDGEDEVDFGPIVDILTEVISLQHALSDYAITIVTGQERTPDVERLVARFKNNGRAFQQETFDTIDAAGTFVDREGIQILVKAVVGKKYSINTIKTWGATPPSCAAGPLPEPSDEYKRGTKNVYCLSDVLPWLDEFKEGDSVPTEIPKGLQLFSIEDLRRFNL